MNGKNLARVLKEAEIPYTVFEMNIDTVREMRKKGGRSIMAMAQARKSSFLFA